MVVIIVVIIGTDEAFGTLSSFRGPRAGAGGVVDEEEDDQTKSGNEAVALNHHSITPGITTSTISPLLYPMTNCPRSLYLLP